MTTTMMADHAVRARLGELHQAAVGSARDVRRSPLEPHSPELQRAAEMLAEAREAHEAALRDYALAESEALSAAREATAADDTATAAGALGRARLAADLAEGAAAVSAKRARAVSAAAMSYSRIAAEAGSGEAAVAQYREAALGRIEALNREYVGAVATLVDISGDLHHELRALQSVVAGVDQVRAGWLANCERGLPENAALSALQRGGRATHPLVVGYVASGAGRYSLVDDAVTVFDESGREWAAGLSAAWIAEQGAQR